MSAKLIVDRMEALEERMVFFLDDNFLTNRRRLEELCDENRASRGEEMVGHAGRTDFIADHPRPHAAAARCGARHGPLGLRVERGGRAGGAAEAQHGREKTRRAAATLMDLGIFSTGIFMVRPDYTDEDFDALYAHINELGIALPMISILTPLPGTQLYKAREHELLTKDRRFFDLLHSVLPTALPRERFYARFAEANRVTWAGWEKANLAVLKNRPRFVLEALPGIARFIARARHYRPILESAETHLRDEVGIIDPNARLAAAPRKRRLPLVEVRKEVA
jgi:hypothetical protein